MKKKLAGISNWALALSWKKKIFGIIFLIIILSIASKAIRGNTPEYSFDTVTRQTITEVVTETGNVSVAGEYDVSSPSNGILSEIYVQNGENVEVDQKLFRVISTATLQQKATTWASYANAKSALDSATAALNGLQSDLFVANKKFMDDRGVINPSIDQKNDPIYIEENADWLQAEANYKNQQAVITGAQATTANAYLAYQATQDSITTSPAAGTVHNLGGVVGSLISAGPVLIISTGQEYTIKTIVNEVDINKIKAGNNVTITFDAIKDKIFNGTIIQTDEFGMNNQGVINYTVFSSVRDDGSRLIKPGMTANLTIDTNEREQVLSVINAAVRPYKGAKAVQIFKNGKLQYNPVTTGIKGLDRTEIISGATEGEKIIIGNTTKSVTPFTPGR